jgi:hypothetical protein
LLSSEFVVLTTCVPPCFLSVHSSTLYVVSLTQLDLRGKKEQEAAENIIRTIKSRRMRWVCSMHGHVKCIFFYIESLKGRDHSENLGAAVRIIFKWILRMQGVCRYGLDLSGSG